MKNETKDTKPKQSNLSAWGLDSKKESLDKMKSFPPVFNLSQLTGQQTFMCVINEDKPRPLSYTNKKGEKVDDFVLNVIDDLTKMEVTLFLSAVSLRMNLFKLVENRDMKGIHIRIGVKLYDSNFGKDTRAYVVQEIRD